MAVTFITPTLETERLILRAPGPQDFDAFAAFLGSQRAQLIDGPGPDIGKIWRAFGHVVGMWVLRGYGAFILTEKGRDGAIAMAGPWHPFDWPEREIGWAIWDQSFEGKGYAREAATAARDFAFGALGWDGAVSYIHPDNARSIALAERLGAVPDASAATRRGDASLVYRHPTPKGAR